MHQHRHFERIETNGIRLRCVVEGQGPLVLLLHGFPQCWYLWRHQIDPLVSAGFRVCVPDQRGYGGSDAPERIDAYDILELTADVIGLVQALGEQRAFLVGHDWGCIVAWHAALLFPHRFHCVLGMSVPYGRARGNEWVEPPGRQDEFWYIRYFQAPGRAEAELEADLRRTLRLFYFGASAAGAELAARAAQAGAAPRPRDARLFEGLPTPEVLPPGLTEADLEYYVEQFRRSGFRGALNWYRNIGRIAALTPCLDEARIRIPAAFVAGAQDPVLGFGQGAVEAQSAWFEDLRSTVLIPDAGHWLQMEKPAETTRAMLDFLLPLRAVATVRA